MSTPFQTSETQAEREPGAGPQQEKLRAAATPTQTPAEKAVVAEIHQRREEEKARGPYLYAGSENTPREFYRQLGHYEKGVAHRNDPRSPIPESVLDQSTRAMDRRMDAEKLNLSADDLKAVKEFERAVLSGDLNKLGELGRTNPKPEVLETIRRDFQHIHMDVNWRAGKMSIQSEWDSNHPCLTILPGAGEGGTAHLTYSSKEQLENPGPDTSFYLPLRRGGVGMGMHELRDPYVAARELALIANARLAELSRR